MLAHYKVIERLASGEHFGKVCLRFDGAQG